MVYYADLQKFDFFSCELGGRYPTHKGRADDGF